MGIRRIRAPGLRGRVSEITCLRDNCISETTLHNRDRCTLISDLARYFVNKSTIDLIDHHQDIERIDLAVAIDIDERQIAIEVWVERPHAAAVDFVDDNQHIQWVGVAIVIYVERA